jgi:hypothetical protein
MISAEIQIVWKSTTKSNQSGIEFAVNMKICKQAVAGFVRMGVVTFQFGLASLRR